MGCTLRRVPWVITGEFLEVDTGNRALQAGVGLGAGQSHLEVCAKIYAVPNMDTPFLTFDSEGAGGHMLGAAVMHKNPYAAAAKFVMSKKQRERERGEESCRVNYGRDRQVYGRAIIPTLKSSKPSGAASPYGRQLNYS